MVWRNSAISNEILYQTKQQSENENNNFYYEYERGKIKLTDFVGLEVTTARASLKLTVFKRNWWSVEVYCWSVEKLLNYGNSWVISTESKKLSESEFLSKHAEHDEGTSVLHFLQNSYRKSLNFCEWISIGIQNICPLKSSNFDKLASKNISCTRNIMK